MGAIDLHCHSTYSDGALTPAELLDRAVARGVTHLALTDHDTTAGLEAAAAAAAGRVRLIPGMEVSSTWEETQIHITALFLPRQDARVDEFVAAQRRRREERAQNIGRKLEALGFADAYARARAQVGPDAVITRGTYARLLAAAGAAPTADAFFARYLQRGRPAFVVTEWPAPGEVIALVHAVGGLAALAHPRRYKMSNPRLRRLLQAFKVAGGDAAEVCYGQQRPCEREFLAALTREYGLMASAGSDFHLPGAWRDLGWQLELPAGVIPIWSHPAAAPYAFPATAATV